MVYEDLWELLDFPYVSATLSLSEVDLNAIKLLRNEMKVRNRTHTHIRVGILYFYNDNQIPETLDRKSTSHYTYTLLSFKYVSSMYISLNILKTISSQSFSSTK